ncbi:hypothetical protein HKX48_006202 [Thoreauomyces humboldtii]|nr:hypothetical protein HKX48_006202 [Thoreauomyces humboldtii]
MQGHKRCLLLLAAAVPYAAATNIVLKFSNILPFFNSSGLEPYATSAANCIDLAVANLSTLLPPHVSIQVQNFDSSANATRSVIGVQQAIANGSIAVLGELTSGDTLPTVRALAGNQIMSCSGSATSGDLSYKMARYFFRTTPQDSEAGAVLGKVIAAYNWKSVGMIFADSPYAKGITDTLSSALASENNINVAFTSQYNPDMSDIESVLVALKASVARIIVWAGNPDDIVAIVPLARKLGLFGPAYVWIAPETALGLYDTIKGNVETGSMSQADLQAISGFLFSTPVEGIGAKWTALQEKYSDVAANNALRYNTTLAQYSGFFYDCAYTILTAFILLEAEGQVSWAQIASGDFNRELSPLLNRVMAANTTGVSGLLAFDENFDRIGKYEINNIQSTGNVVVGSTNDTNYDLSFTGSPTLFYGGLTTIPSSSILLSPNWTTFKDPLAIILMLLYAGMMLVTGVSVVLTHVWQASPAIKALSPQFMMIMGSAMELAYATIFTSLGQQSKLTCNLRAWLFTISFGIVLGCLIAKTYRIWRVFANERLASPLRVSQILRMAGAFTVGEAIIMAVWSGYSPLLPTKIVDTSTDTYNYVCESTTGNNAFIGTIFAYNALLLVVATYLAVATRAVPSKYSEAKYIAFTVYSLLIWCTLIIAVSFTGGTSSSLAFLIQSFGVLFVTSTTWALLIGRVLVGELTKQKEESMPLAGTSSRVLGATSPVNSKSAASAKVLPRAGPNIIKTSPGSPTWPGAPGQGSYAQVDVGEYPCRNLSSWFGRWERYEIMLSTSPVARLALRHLDPGNPRKPGFIVLVSDVRANRSKAAETSFELTFDGRTFLVQVDSDQDADEWVRRLRHAGTLRGESSNGSKSIGAGSTGGNTSPRPNRADAEV